MLKKAGLFLLLNFISVLAFAQVLKPIKWKYQADKEEVKIGEEIDLVFYADIDKGWYLYSSDFDPDLGPMVTVFTFDPHSSYELVGDVKPIGPKKKYDEMWGGEYTYFTEKAEFRQKIKIKGAPLKIEGSYEYQVCTDIDGKCIPFDEEFSFNNIKVNKVTEAEDKAASPKTTLEEQETETTSESSGKNLDISVGDHVEKNGDEAMAFDDDKIAANNALLLGGGDESQSLLGFMALAFLAGLAALLTPCVFPMIPMTVSFFTNSSNNRNQAIFKAFMYGFSIVAIYTLAGTIVAKINGPEFANWLSTHWLPNILFFAIFLIFGLSFLGLFEITLPSRFVNKVDQQADKGGLLGIFFMAFTLVLVSFSCTGPIVGSLLVASAGGEILKPVAGMMAFSMAFAVPFTLFAIFPEWLSKMPKSGGWLNSVKVVLGFLELALALKFLSIADQVYHWNILDREVYLALWIVIFALLGFYLLGKIRLPHDSKLESVSVPRLVIALVTFSFVVYLIPGMFGAPLKSLAGYLPPMQTHDFNIEGLLSKNANQNVLLANSQSDDTCEKPKFADFLHLPHGLHGYFDLDQAIECARAQGKPIFIDFTGHGCVNCREMEARVWSHPEVLKRLKEDYIVLALYVDEKMELPEDDWYVSEYDGKVKKTIGKQNADLQIRKYNNNAQPYYILLGHNGEVLAKPKAYDYNVQNFINFLDEGVDNFKKLQSQVSELR